MIHSCILECKRSVAMGAITIARVRKTTLIGMGMDLFQMIRSAAETTVWIRTQ